MKPAVIVQDPQRILTHLPAGKEFRGGYGKVQTELHPLVMHPGTEFIIG